MSAIRTQEDNEAWLAQVRTTALTIIAQREAEMTRRYGDRRRARPRVLSQREKDKIWRDVKDFYQARDRGEA